MTPLLTIRSSRCPYAVEEYGDLAQALATLPEEGALVLLDQFILDHHGDTLRSVRPRLKYLPVVATEEQKSFENLAPIFVWLLENGLKRDGRLVVIGGGVLQDIGCFISSVLFRGVRWDLIPSTLLAQCDSCIGSKSSINIQSYKNQIGTFYPPDRVLLVTALLESLPWDEVRSGMGEVIKLHLLAGDERFNWLSQRLDRVKTDPAVLPECIRSNLLIKQPYIEKDEYDTGIRNLLNYGHTFGHAYESATLARNKYLTSRVLRVAGIPVPDHFVVPTADAAVEAAGRLGYPVVVKPVDLDGGVAVSVGLTSPDEVSAAFHRSRALSNSILVEKHMEGRDYRVIVFQDQAIWAHERLPAGVTGDGHRTIAELVEQTNADPARRIGPNAALKALVLDDEAAALLGQAGMNARSVLAEGRFARLRRVNSIRNGGTAVPAFEQMHPDNRLLAVRAAQALRLDVAGVDVLTPDISRSWRESWAAINDVNGQPGTRQVMADLPALMLRKLVPGDGRIPTVLVLGAAPTTPVARGLEELLLRGKVVAGCHDAGGVRINGEIVMQGAVAAYDAGLAMTVDRSVGAIVLSINDDGVLRTGLPFPRFDVLVLAGAHILPHSAVPETPNLNPVLNELLSLILPACDGTVLTVDQSGLTLNGFAPMTSASWQHLPAEAERFYTTILGALRSAEARHGMTWEQRSGDAESGVPNR